MPLNCIPVTTTIDALHQKTVSTQEKLWIDCGFYGGIIPDNLDDIEPLAEAGVLGFKAFMSHSGIDEFPKVAESHLRKALSILANQAIPVLVHAELENGVETSNSHHTYESFQATRPKSWENNAIKLLIQLCREYETHIHIVHLSSSDILPEISQTRDEGLPLTVETCPHYLHFASERISDGDTRFKCAPPIWDIGSLTLHSGIEKAGYGGFSNGLGRHFIDSVYPSCDLDGMQTTRVFLSSTRRLVEQKTCKIYWQRPTKRPDCPRL
jgi:allantoinase